MRRWRLPIDPFTVAMVAVVLLASALPARGEVARGLGWGADAGVALIFFLHGAKLSREAIVAGIVHWRLHLVVLGCTYALFPLLALASQPLSPSLISPELMMGVLFLAALPSTVQSSIAFTSIAGGNVSAAICAASLSNLAGVLLTPALVALLIQREGELAMLDAVWKIVQQILAPFVLGHLVRPWLGAWLMRHKAVIGRVDRGVILLIVYVAFSASVVEGLWRQLGGWELVRLLLMMGALLALMLTLTRWLARALGFGREDEIAIVFCGTKKSLASGMPMASVLFADAAGLGALVLPLMIFHQIQLMACGVIATRYAKGAPRLDEIAQDAETS